MHKAKIWTREELLFTGHVFWTAAVGSGQALFFDDDENRWFLELLKTPRDRVLQGCGALLHDQATIKKTGTGAEG